RHLNEEANVRDDIAALVDAWDKKTAKKAKPYGDLLEHLGGILGDDTALSVVPALSKDPEMDARSAAWGVLCLTDHRLIFSSRTGQARFDLSDIAELNIYRGGGESFLVSMMTGGMIEVRVGSDSTYYEVETQSATAHIWPVLQSQWAEEKDAAKQRARKPLPVAVAAAPSVADELSKLADLRSQGILNDEEFEQQKAKLLAT
ncbi:MAG: hypothetical protein QOF43_1749, partial [Gaiellaceae bacterium]|nr:hypothetical protein [Gaiellaceae bacterium]